ncbi:hypothetical protein K4K59_008796 [Colletotrichum sp. SAR11_240]|nr:hypothetical protein K4K59_008796 [Colletotrichum sp. SAR11_240]
MSIIGLDPERGLDHFGETSSEAIEAKAEAEAFVIPYISKAPRQLPRGQPFYVVSRGKKIGIFADWREVKKLTTEYPGARYCKRATFQAAHERFVDDISDDIINAIFAATFASSSPAQRSSDRIGAAIVNSDPAPQRTLGLNQIVSPISTPIRSSRSTSEVIPAATPTRSPVIELDAGQEDTFNSSPMTIQSFNFSPTKPIDPVSSPPACSPLELDTSKLDGSDIAEVNVEGTPRQPGKRGRRPKSTAKPNGEVTKANVKGTPRQPGKRGRPPKSITQAKAQRSATGPVEDRRHRISKSEPKSSPSLAQKTLTAMFKPANPQ